MLAIDENRKIVEWTGVNSVMWEKGWKKNQDNQMNKQVLSLLRKTIEIIIKHVVVVLVFTSNKKWMRKLLHVHIHAVAEICFENCIRKIAKLKKTLNFPQQKKINKFWEMFSLNLSFWICWMQKACKYALKPVQPSFYSIKWKTQRKSEIDSRWIHLMFPTIHTKQILVLLFSQSSPLFWACNSNNSLLNWHLAKVEM